MSIKAKLRVVLLASVLLPMFLSAQKPWTIGGRLGYGLLWPHRQDLWILIEKHSVSLEMFAEKQVTGDKPWHQYFKGPSYGVGLLFVNFANPEKIGTAARVLPYFYLPFSNKGKGSFGVRMGWGLGYIAKPYDRLENTKQIAIGSNINTAILFMLEYRKVVGRNSFIAGFGIDHWSNGSYKQPNLGINYIGLNVGFSRALGAVETYVFLPDTSCFNCTKRTQSLVFGFGINEVGRPYNGQYTVYSLSGQVQWRVSKKSALAIGGDVFNKGALALSDERPGPRPRIEYTQFGVHGEYALILGRNEVYFQMGAYLYSAVQDKSDVFHRVGYRYKAGKHLLLNLSLKSHYAVADHFELGVGYKWN